MVWLKLGDTFPEQPEIVALSDQAFRLHISGMAYSARNLTDGFIPREVSLGQLRQFEGGAAPVILELEGGGLWRRGRGGWTIDKFLDDQPSKAEVEARRKADRRRAARSRGRKGRFSSSDDGARHGVTHGVTSRRESDRSHVRPGPARPGT